MAAALEIMAQGSVSSLRKVYKARTRPRRGTTLRPGPLTPLWNALAQAAGPTVQRHGDQAKLARFLGVPRQRVHEYLVAKTACPDTERALLLLIWLQARLNGRDPA